MRFTLERATVEFNGIPALTGISTYLSGSGAVVLTGPTGAGKTTFLRLLYADLIPSVGEVHIDGSPTTSMKVKHRQALRRRMGIVEQNCRLVSDYSVFENVLMPLAVNKEDKESAHRQALETLADLNISYIRHKLPRELSGGELHLSALARALASKPEVLIADEPAGGLDKATAIEVAKALRNAVDAGIGIIVSTHNEYLARELAEARRIELYEGAIVTDEVSVAPYIHPRPPSNQAEI